VTGWPFRREAPELKKLQAPESENLPLS